MNPADRLAGDASAIPHWSPPTDRLVASATRVSVERRPEHRRIAGAARPGGVPAAVTEAGLVTDEDSARAERVAIGHRVGGWVIHPPAVVCTRSPSTPSSLGRAGNTHGQD
jgi:hypothetical protein